MNKAEQNVLMQVFLGCHDDEVSHMELRLIRDAQAPRFEELKDSHPEIYADLMYARTGPHEDLLQSRKERMINIVQLLEGTYEDQ